MPLALPALAKALLSIDIQQTHTKLVYFMHIRTAMVQSVELILHIVLYVQL